MSERAPPAQLQLDLEPEDDLTFEEWMNQMNDPAKNPQLRGDPKSTTRQQSRPSGTSTTSREIPASGHLNIGKPT